MHFSDTLVLTALPPKELDGSASPTSAGGGVLRGQRRVVTLV